ncbi:MAG: hypothetical protein IT443_11705 [Phycisphaeraceae bacterium]|nr:hypothetical protein [Phycisphaeraceae bacterium]
MAKQTKWSGMIMGSLCLAVLAGVVAQSWAEEEKGKDAAASPQTAAEAPKGAISDLMPLQADASPFLAEEHFVVKWVVLGPFKYKDGDFSGNEQQGAADHEFMPGEAELDGTQGAPEGMKWEEKLFKASAQAGQVDLEGHYGTMDYATAYAVGYLYCEEAMEGVKIYTGSDDYIKVWLNGKLVQSYNTKRRGSDWDQDEAVDLKLEKGYNRVVVKVVDVVGGWDFYFRVADKDDNPIVVKARESAK